MFSPFDFLHDEKVRYVLRGMLKEDTGKQALLPPQLWLYQTAHGTVEGPQDQEMIRHLLSNSHYHITMHNQIEIQEHKPEGGPWEGRDPFTSGDQMTATTTVLGLANGMIGVSYLILPVIGVTAGYLTTVWVCLVLAYTSYYTADLIVIHLGKGKSIKDCILAHYSNKYHYMIAYSFFIWLSFLPMLFSYFKIICIQVEGLLGLNSQWLAPMVALLLILAIIIIRFSHIGEELLALGIISIITYLAFLTWAQVTAPAGIKTVPASGDPLVLAGTLVGAYQIHDFLAQNIIKNPRRQEYHGVVKWTFSIGFLAYIYITLGSFAIVNRPTRVKHPQIINDYFGHGQWQMTIIELVYIIHMVTAFPNFLIVSMIRFFQMFKIDLSYRISFKQGVYVLAVILLSYGFYVSGINLISFFSLSGAVVGYTYVFVIPIWIHIKCVWFDRSSGHIEGDEKWNARLRPNICQCQVIYPSKNRLILQTTFLILVLIVGLAMMIITVLSMFKRTRP